MLLDEASMLPAIVNAPGETLAEALRVMLGELLQVKYLVKYLSLLCPNNWIINSDI